MFSHPRPIMDVRPARLVVEKLPNVVSVSVIGLIKAASSRYISRHSCSLNRTTLRVRISRHMHLDSIQLKRLSAAKALRERI